MAGYGQLKLELRDFVSSAQWRWLLTEERTSRPLADHQVSLDVVSDDFLAFADLYSYLWLKAVPDRRAESEAQIVARIGAWAGEQLLGRDVGAAIVAAAPVTVRVAVPPEAGFVASWPLELAHADGRPLASRGDVTVVYDLVPQVPGARRQDVESGSAVPLRMLAVFSLPTATGVLALRRERYELTRLVRQIGARQRRRVNLTVVQYGVTREKLAAIAEAGDGWDLLHLSGHGGVGEFLLETTDGSPDPVPTLDLVRMLQPLRHRVRLALVSACESAAATVAQTLRLVGLTEQAEALERDAVGTPGPVAGVGPELAAGLMCPVVAMRYPVADDFAIAFAQELYERLLGRRDDRPGSGGQPLGAAVARAVVAAAGPVPLPGRPALSVATPVLIGGPDAAGLVLPVPQGEPVLDLALVRMERFPREAERFVGRTAVMARASAALAPGSGRAGVLLHGMTGSGKTACATELAWRHQDSFEAVAFWQAPPLDEAFGGALASLAAALDVQLGGHGFAMSGQITSAESLVRFTPRLLRLLEDNGILLVLDNLEMLLAPDGTWRDPRWEPLIGAMTRHRGESRVILTSRIPPAALGDQVLFEPVHALDLAEAAALARELPGLRALLHADGGPLRDQASVAAVMADRDLVRRVLHVVQGHPKLMELAAATTDRSRLATQLDAAEAAAGGPMLEAFFRDGTSGLDAAQFLDTLTAWTTTAIAALREPVQLMARFLARVANDDQNSTVVTAIWANLRRRLSLNGEPPQPATLLAALAAAALIQPDPLKGTSDGPETVAYRMHTAVSQAINLGTPPNVAEAIDIELATFWRQVAEHARQREGGEEGQVIVRSCLAAVPYLLRLRQWHTASALLDQVLRRDLSPMTTQAALPALRAIAAATGAVDDLGLLARALRVTDPAEAETLLRASLDNATAIQDFRLAAGVAVDLIKLLRDVGRLREALDLASQLPGYTGQAGLGSWNQLADYGRRLQILGLMGEHQQVLNQIPVLQAQMDALPAAAGSNETVEPWDVRETTLSIGRNSALALTNWQQAIDLNATILASRQARSAGAHEIARTRFNDSGPLIRLGRFAVAARLLAECQQVFEDHHDLARLTMVLSARADLEDERGNLAAAVAFQQAALRYGYSRPQPRTLAGGHHNLATYLGRAGSDPAAQRAHRLSAALIYQFTGMTHELADTVADLAAELSQDAGSTDIPTTMEDVIRIASQTEGVRLSLLITTLEPDPQAAESALAQILATAASTNPSQDASIGE